MLWLIFDTTYYYSSQPSFNRSFKKFNFRKYQRKCKVLIEESINNEKVGEGIIVYYVVFSLLQILQFQMRLILMLNNMIGRQNSFRFIFIVLLLNYYTLY